MVSGGSVLLGINAGSKAVAAIAVVTGASATAFRASDAAEGAQYLYKFFSQKDIEPVNFIRDKVPLFQKYPWLYTGVEFVTTLSAGASLNILNAQKNAAVLNGAGSGSGAKDIIQYENLKSQYAADEISNAERVGSGLKSDPYHRAASFVSEEQLAQGRTFSFTNGNGRHMTMLQTEGELNGVTGVFEYILNSQGQVEHQLFKPGAGITGPR